MNEIRSADTRLSDVDAAGGAWRVRPLNLLLLVACIFGGPMAIPAVWGDGGVPPGWRLLGVMTYLIVVVTAICTHWGYRVRSWILVGSAYAAATLALANRGLAGYGRVGLAVYPCVVIVMIGPRAGWCAAGLSIAIYGIFAAMVSCDVVGSQMTREDPTSPALWLAQGVGLVLVIVPSVVLLGWFRAHHMRSLDAERRISQQLQEEMARRAAAYESLNREHAHRERLEERIAQLGEEERRQLGREIHDGICQQLTAALLRCTALQEQLISRQSGEAAPAGRLRMLIQEMLDDAYEISKGVWPMGPEPHDLVPAMHAMVRKTLEESGLACDFRHQRGIAVADGQTAMHLYRIAQEAVRNAVKHAKASRVSVQIQGGADRIVLTVTDDGCGPPEATKSRGMGLSIMAHRARSIGGTLTIVRAEGGGTVVRCEVPQDAL